MRRIRDAQARVRGPRASTRTSAFASAGARLRVAVEAWKADLPTRLTYALT